MRPIVVGLVITLFSVLLMQASGAVAATPSIDPDAKAKGMSAAPGIIKGANLGCELASARYMGDQNDPKTKVKSSFYEIACKGAEGFVAEVRSDKTPGMFLSCVETSAMPGVKCLLPENADPKAGIAPLVAKAMPDCQVSKAASLGQATDGTVFLEVGCQDGGDFILETTAPPDSAKPATLQPCLAAASELGPDAKCQFSDAATQLAYIDKAAAQSGTNCQIKDRRFVGVNSDNSDLLYEIACQDGKGYLLDQSKNLTSTKAMDCVGQTLCQLTSNVQAESAQSDLYTKLARNAGFACDVNKYAPFDVNVPGHEVVELSCSNRPDGAIGIFPANSTEKAEVYDCAHSELLNYRCSFTQPSAAYSSLTGDLKKLGKATCEVSAARVVGVSADKTGYIEVGCSDGTPGYMIAYTLAPLAPKSAYGCALARDLVGGCRLPANHKPS